MSGPWERFAPQPDEGPWTKYQKAAGSLQDVVGASAAVPSSLGATGDDVLKSAGIGLVQGAIGVAGLPGTLREAGGALGSMIGISPETQSAIGGALRAMPGPGGLVSSQVAPSARTIQNKVEEYTGQFYQPQTTAGKYARTVGEFAPGALLPAAGLASRATNVLAPAIASEAAGQATEGTTLEPWARPLGALAGGVAGARGLTAIERGLERARAPAIPAPIASDDLINIASGQYDSARNIPVHYAKSELDALKSRATAQLQTQGIFASDAPKTYAAIDRIGTGVTPDAAGMMSTRRTFQNALGSIDGTERLAAGMARDALDDLIKGPSAGQRAAQTPRERLAALIAEADGNYAAAKRAETIEGKLDAAGRQAASANSGLNEGNNIRQRLRSMLESNKQSRGLDAQDIAAIEGAIRGDKIANGLRYTGNLLGGGGGLGALVTAGVTGSMGLPVIGSAAVAGAGLGLRSASNAVTKRAADRALNTILTRAPAYQQLPNAVRGGRFIPQAQGMSKREALARAMVLQEIAGY